MLSQEKIPKVVALPDCLPPDAEEAEGLHHLSLRANGGEEDGRVFGTIALSCKPPCSAGSEACRAGAGSASAHAL